MKWIWKKMKNKNNLPCHSCSTGDREQKKSYGKFVFMKKQKEMKILAAARIANKREKEKERKDKAFHERSNVECFSVVQSALFELVLESQLNRRRAHVQFTCFKHTRSLSRRRIVNRQVLELQALRFVFFFFSSVFVFLVLVTRSFHFLFVCSWCNWCRALTHSRLFVFISFRFFSLRMPCSCQEYECICVRARVVIACGNVHWTCGTSNSLRFVAVLLLLFRFVLSRTLNFVLDVLLRRLFISFPRFSSFCIFVDFIGFDRRKQLKNTISFESVETMKLLSDVRRSCGKWVFLCVQMMISLHRRHKFLFHFHLMACEKVADCVSHSIYLKWKKIIDKVIRRQLTITIFVRLFA